MDHQTKVNYWLLQNVSRLELRVEHLGWIEKLMPSMTDVAVRLKVGEHKWSGWGYGETDDLALTKAFAEVAERAVMQENRFPTSNGLAAHLSPERAAQAAISELRERDLFLCHFYTMTPFAAASESIQLYALEGVRSWFEQQGVEFKLFRLGTTGFVSLLDGRSALEPFGFIVGAAIKDSLEASAHSAAVEVARAGYWLLSNGKPIESLSLERFRKIAAPRFDDHGRLALDLKYAARIAPLFEPSAASHLVGSGESHSAAIHVDHVQLRSEKLRESPLAFARATSTGLQDLSVGDCSLAVANLSRLSEFTGHRLQQQDINSLPHPFN